MLVFAGAGLDSALKQVIKDAYADVVHADKNARRKATEHFSKKLGEPGERRAKDLVRWLFDGNPRAAMTADLVRDLTSDSLQSRQQLERIADFLQVNQIGGMLKNAELTNAFKARNKIIHELDVNFAVVPRPGIRTQTARQRDEMVKFANLILDVASALINQIDQKISQ